MRKIFNQFYILTTTKRYILVTLLVANLSVASSQTTIYENDSLFYNKINTLISAQKFDDALKTMDTLLKRNHFLQASVCFDLKGYIYKEKYKFSNTIQDYDSCLFYYSKAKSIIRNFDNTMNSVLKHVTNRNHILAGNSLQNLQIDSAELYYALCRKGIKLIDSTNLRERDSDFYLACGSICQSIYEKDRKINKLYAAKALEYHKKVLLLDSNNYSAVYNTMILYYNDAVTNIKNAEYCKQVETANTVDWNDPKKPVPSIEKLLECVKPEEFDKYNFTPLLRKALPYALKAYELKPTNRNILEALIGITYGTRDKQKYTQYKKELQKLG